MITVYKEERNKLISVLKGDTLPILKEGTWLDISSPTPELLEVLAKRTKIPLTFLMASLDPEESGRVDNEGNNTLIVLDAPFEIQNKKDSKTFFETMPFIIVYNQKIFITIHKEGILLKDLLLSRNKVIEPHKHVDDVSKLLNVLEKIVNGGDTIICIEHNLDVIKMADYIIDIGPDGGDKGGEIVATGTPEEIITNPNSYTAFYLKRSLEEDLKRKEKKKNE